MEQVQKEPRITEWYYLTGGTALSQYYLHHRYSEDLDFFTTNQVNEAVTDAFSESLIRKSIITSYTKQPISGLFMYTYVFADGTKLKVDFNEYDFQPIEPHISDRNIKIDSLYDIAVNKLASILGRRKARDFVDLYFCIKQEGYFWEQLFGRLLDKFGVTYEGLTVVRQFTQVKDVTDYPTMLVPFDKEEMIAFYLAEAKKLEPKIFK